MSRPKFHRRIGYLPVITTYRPIGLISISGEDIVLSFDEFEAIRLADLSGLYQEDAANKMNISRQTFGRIVVSARRKIADALVNGKSLRIEGGPVSVESPPRFRCPTCTRSVECPHRFREDDCPKRGRLKKLRSAQQTNRTEEQ